MSNIALRVENLGKRYRIGGPQEKYQTFRDTLARAASAPLRKARDLLRGQAYGAAGLSEEIWALRDVSFEVKHGEVVGIIGRNGAGKSTLLKILSRITEPTTGYADVYGRVGALLEVGTGFHQELTGRENIYLNGAILGMSRADIDRKFDEIVDFAGVEKFIDTPVKHYSSGMGLRLGFAVAAHLEPDILVVDEVLAVGDAEFQRKCLGKMSDVASEGRTVLFVSHNMAAVSALCRKSLWLDQGRLRDNGDAHTLLQKYSEQSVESTLVPLLQREDRRGSGSMRFSHVQVFGGDSFELNRAVVSGQPATVMIKCSTRLSEVRSVEVSVIFSDIQGKRLFTCNNGYTGFEIKNYSMDKVMVCRINKLALAVGVYRLSLWMGVNQERADYIEDVAQFTVENGDYYGTGRSTIGNRDGTFLVDHYWELADDDRL